MAGSGLPGNDGFTRQLQNHLTKLGYKVAVTNFAVSGRTTADGLNIVGQVVNARPDCVLLGLGSNDALRFLDPGAAKKNLGGIIKRLQHERIPILLLGAKAPLNWGLGYKRKFDAIFPALANEYDLPIYSFILDGVALVPSLNQPDGVHPNAAGVAVIVERFSPYVTSFLDSLVAK